MGQWGRSFPPGVTRYTLYKGRPLMGGPRPLTPCLAKFLFSTGRPPVQPVHAHGKRLLRSTPFPALHAYIYIHIFRAMLLVLLYEWYSFAHSKVQCDTALGHNQLQQNPNFCCNVLVAMIQGSRPSPDHPSHPVII
jgi:hypothetical protein